MTSVLSGIAACLLYLASLASQLFALHDGMSRERALQLSRMLAAPALLLHILSLSPALLTDGGLSLGLFNAGSLFFWMIATLAYIASWRLPLANLLLILYLSLIHI